MSYVSRKAGSRLGDYAAAEIQAQILTGEFSPGTSLPTETELGEILGVSRTVVRDAIRTVAARGLVHVRQGRGTIVTTPDDGMVGKAMLMLLLRSDLTVGDVLEGRDVIEAHLIPLAAAHATEEDMAELWQHLQEFDQAVEEKQWHTAHRAHLQLHTGLLKAIHVPALEILLKPLHEVVLLTSTPPNVEDPALWEVAAHTEIVEALRGRDTGRLAQALRVHYEQLRAPAYSTHRKTLFREARTVRALLEEMLLSDGFAQLEVSHA